jgi:hypothetical protein
VGKPFTGKRAANALASVASTVPKCTSPFNFLATFSYVGARRLQCPHLEGGQQSDVSHSIVQSIHVSLCSHTYQGAKNSITHSPSATISSKLSYVNVTAYLRRRAHQMRGNSERRRVVQQQVSLLLRCCTTKKQHHSTQENSELHRKTRVPTTNDHSQFLHVFWEIEGRRSWETRVSSRSRGA